MGAEHGPTVGDLMTTDLVTIASNASLQEAARLMEGHHVSGLPVVDTTGTLVGVISQTDLLRSQATEHLWTKWPGLAVRHLMTSPAVTVVQSTPVAEAAALMERRRIHRVVVVSDDDESRPVGILSTSDLVRVIAEGSANATE
ncbi:MAG: CBS domain-containing protein [Dehalococcoidia bacterium]